MTSERRQDEAALEGILTEAGYNMVSIAVSAILESDWFNRKINEAYTRGADETRTNMLPVIPPQYRRNGW